MLSASKIDAYVAYNVNYHTVVNSNCKSVFFVGRVHKPINSSFLSSAAEQKPVFGDKVMAVKRKIPAKEDRKCLLMFPIILI